MTSFTIDSWDEGRVQVNAEFATLLQAHGLTTFDAWMHFADGDVARQIGRRVTRRIVLDSPPGKEAFYLKQHGPLSLWETVKPYLHLRRPSVGARPEWDAILRFHQLGLPTMTPVAFGERGASSFLITSALDDRQNLLEWVNLVHKQEGAWKGQDTRPRARLRVFIDDLARIARTMHAAGLHHQDFYLNHLLVPREHDRNDIRVIDLGRVQWKPRLSSRWIVKDLSQLNYSARNVPRTERLRFLRNYLGRPLNRQDRKLIVRLTRKAQSIDRHTRKNAL